METLKELQIKLQKITTENQKEIESITKEIANNEDRIATVTEKLVASQNTGNIKAYTSSREELQILQYTKDFLTKKLDQLKSRILMNETEAQEQLEYILEQANRLRTEQFDKVSTMLKEMKNISENSTELCLLANELHNTISFDILKNDIPIIGKPKVFNKDMVAGFYEQVTGVPMYNKTINGGE